MIVAAMLWDTASRARLTEAARNRAHLHLCDRPSELRTLVENGLTDVVVIEMEDPWGVSTLPVVREIKADYPSIPIVLYCALSASNSRDMLEFAKAGVNELVLRDVDDVRGPLATALTEAGNRRSAMVIFEEIADLVPQNVGTMIRYCLENGRRPLTVEEVASALGVHRKTLVDRLSHVGMTPSAVISWCRLLVSAKLLEDPGHTVEQVALLLDFPSGTSMRNMVKRYTGLRTTEVRQNGGLRCVLHAFKQKLARPVPVRRVAS